MAAQHDVELSGVEEEASSEVDPEHECEHDGEDAVECPSSVQVMRHE
jgi:hypothetical protein